MNSRLLIACVITVAAGIANNVFGAFNTPAMMAIGCDAGGFAFTLGKQSVPWMMTPTGPLPGNEPGASLGYHMKCDEAISALGMK
jgi:hypothetical protein